MKVVITGHSSGIGKSLLETFEENGQTCIGFDILSGCDLRTEEGIQEVIESCKSADIFINNALPNQSRLLKEVHDIWLGQNKIIVNLSSAVTYFYEQSNVPREFAGYYEHKSQLNAVSKELTKARQPYIMNVRPSWVDTQLVSEITDVKISPKDLASLIYFNVINREKYQVIDIVIR